MKRWLVGLLLVVLAGLVLVSVINSDSNSDPVAALKKLGAYINRNEQGEVVEVRFARSWGLVPDLFLSLFSDSTKITDAGLVHLKGLTTLRSLSLSLGHTEASAAGVADLQKSLPNCKIQTSPIAANTR